MKSANLPLACLLLIASLLSRPIRGSSPALPAEKALAGKVYLPLVQVTSQAASADTILVDHRYTDIHAIPDYWLEQAKKLAVHYAHTSHGSQVLSGLEWLEQRDPRFNVDIQASGDVTLPGDTTALRVYDGNNYPGNTYITPDMFWETSDGLEHTRSVAATGWFDLSLWTWCGQMSYYSDAQVLQYMDALEGLDAQYPDVDFIYYTGHTDGTPPAATCGGTMIWCASMFAKTGVSCSILQILKATIRRGFSTQTLRTLASGATAGAPSTRRASSASRCPPAPTLTGCSAR